MKEDSLIRSSQRQRWKRPQTRFISFILCLFVGCFIQQSFSQSILSLVQKNDIRLLQDEPKEGEGEETEEKKEDKLNVLGGYTIKVDESTEKYCPTKDFMKYKKDTIEIKPERGSTLLGFYGQVKKPLFDFLKHKKLVKLIKEGWFRGIVFIGLPLVAGLFSLCFLPFVIYWVLSFCIPCCKRKSAEERYEKKFDCCKVFTNCCVLTVLGLTILFGSIWTYQTYKMSTTLKPLSCTVAIGFSEAVYGVSHKEAFFPGLAGYNYFLSILDKELKGIVESESASQKIKDSLAQKSFAEFNATLKATNSSLKNITNQTSKLETKVSGCKNNSIKCELQYLKNMTEFISPKVKNETGNFSNAGEMISMTAIQLNVLLNNKTIAQDFIGALDSFSNMSSQIETEVVKIKKQIVKNFDYKKTSNLVYSTLIIFSCSIAGIMIAYLVFWFVNWIMKTYNWLLLLSKSIMICTVTLGLLVNVFAILALVVGAVMVNGCSLFDEAINKPQNMKNFNFGSTFDRMLDTCFYKNSTGDIINVIESEKIRNRILALRHLLDGLTHERELIGLAQKKKEDLEINLYFKPIKNMLEGKADLAGYIPKEEGFQPNLMAIKDNLKKLTENVLFYSTKMCPADMENTDQNTDETYKRDKAFCIGLSTYSVNWANRYKDINGFTEKMAGQLETLQKCAKSFKEINQNIVLNLTGKDKSISKEYETFVTKYQENYGHLKMAREAMKNTIAFMEAPAIDSKFAKIFNCKMLRQEILFLKSSLCGKFTDSVAMQGAALTTLGVLVTILGFAMFNQVRMMERDKNKLPAHMKTDTDPAIQMNELML